MKVEVVRYTPAQWYALAEDAHRAVFGEIFQPWLDRIDFALLGTVGGRITGYATCKERDAETLQWQFGGIVDKSRSFDAVRGFHALLDESRRAYGRVLTFVKNDNVGCLHLAMKHGFRIIGVRNFKNEILCELMLEF